MPVIEQEIHIEGAYPLAGTLTLPDKKEKPFPVMVMVHGSGEVDRDENAKRMKINAFKELSELAAEEGFAALRYDKRGIGKSAGNYLETGVEDLIDDAAAVVVFARRHPLLDEEKIILTGHSEGALLAPAVHHRIHVQGMILIAGTAEALGEATAWQREALKQDILSTKGLQGKILRLLKVDEKIENMNNQLAEKLKATDKPVIRFRGKKINAKWNREHGEFTVRDYLPGVTCPVLAVTGSKDVQVKPEQVKEICSLTGGECKAYIIPDMTHLLRKTKACKMSAILNDYKNQVKQPVDAELKSVVRKWLNAWKKQDQQQRTESGT